MRGNIALIHSLLLLINLFAGVALGLNAVPPPPDQGECLVYFGTRSSPTGKGIYMCRLNNATGTLTSLGVAVETADPAFLAIHPSHRFLYAVRESGGFEGTPNGAVSAFAIDTATGKLTLLNQQNSGGQGPCHLAVDQSGKCVLVAHYGGGSVAAFPIRADGSLGSVSALLQHHGSGPNPKRQEGPHAHSVGFDIANHRAFCADLGLDKLLVYQFDPTTAALSSNNPPSASLAPGAGPRHFAMDPNGRHLYVINELNNTITAFDYDESHGALKESQTITTLPDKFTGFNTSAEIAILPNGKFLYGSNRGHDSIAVYAVDQSTGKLTLVEHQSSLGRTPRAFGIDPSGSFLLVANQDSNSLVVFRINPKTGRLKATGQTLDVPSPVCVVFLPLS
ncbi:MAG TPA: lactonase family protein [Verrucomicrobiae bacterium]|nr:lactonase family protein [Verrucomicrobiae bacterium]